MAKQTKKRTAHPATNPLPIEAPPPVSDSAPLPAVSVTPPAEQKQSIEAVSQPAPAIVSPAATPAAKEVQQQPQQVEPPPMASSSCATTPPPELLQNSAGAPVQDPVQTPDQNLTQKQVRNPADAGGDSEAPILLPPISPMPEGNGAMLMSAGTSVSSRRWQLLLIEGLFILFNIVFFMGFIKKVLWSAPILDYSFPLSGSEITGQQLIPRLNVLCLGLDSVEGTHRTDTILLTSVDMQTKQIHIVSVPRDTRVVVEGKSHKINEIMARYGIEVLRALIEDLMDIRIHRFVKVDFQAFTRVIDVIGGIDLVIEHAMNYDDNWANLHIHFTPGPIHLDGRKALEYVRFRADANADLGRIKRQQRFVTAVIEKVSTPGIMLKIPEILGEVFRNIQTDLSIKETLELAYGFKGKGVKIQTESLPGEARYIEKVSYFVPFKDQAMALGSKWFSTLSSLDLEASFTVQASVSASINASGVEAAVPPASQAVNSSTAASPTVAQTPPPTSTTIASGPAGSTITSGIPASPTRMASGPAPTIGLSTSAAMASSSASPVATPGSDNGSFPASLTPPSPQPTGSAAGSPSAQALAIPAGSSPAAPPLTASESVLPKASGTGSTTPSTTAP